MKAFRKIRNFSHRKTEAPRITSFYLVVILSEALFLKWKRKQKKGKIRGKKKSNFLIRFKLFPRTLSRAGEEKIKIKLKASRNLYEKFSPTTVKMTFPYKSEFSATEENIFLLIMEAGQEGMSNDLLSHRTASTG